VRNAQKGEKQGKKILVKFFHSDLASVKTRARMPSTQCQALRSHDKPGGKKEVGGNRAGLEGGKEVEMGQAACLSSLG